MTKKKPILISKLSRVVKKRKVKKKILKMFELCKFFAKEIFPFIDVYLKKRMF